MVPREKSRRLREVLARAQVTRTHSRQILVQCEATLALYEGLLPSKKEHEFTR